LLFREIKKQTGLFGETQIRTVALT